MFGVLPESNPRPRGRRGVTMMSVAVHAGAIVLAAWVTAESAEPARTVDREVAMPDVFTQPRHAPPAAPAPRRSGIRSETTLELPDAPTFPQVPGFAIPTGLPPVEESLGDPFANVEPANTGVVNGVGHRGSGLEPGGALDNHIAEKPALPLPSNAPPRYPESLRSAAIEGSVEIEFIVDPNGRVRPGSVVILRSDHARFLDSVRDALAGYRYLPAEVGGSPVAVRVRQRFAFVLNGQEQQYR